MDLTPRPPLPHAERGSVVVDGVVLGGGEVGTDG